MAASILNNFATILKEIRLEKPSDTIIQQIRELIRSGQLNTGEKPPSERKLEDMLGSSYGHVRGAIRKRETHSTRLDAQKRIDENIQNLERALEAYCTNQQYKVLLQHMKDGNSETAGSSYKSISRT